MQQDSQTNTGDKSGASGESEGKSSSALTKKAETKQSTPVRTKQVKEKSGHYKNIFEVTSVEGKRQRKPKVVIDMEELSKGEKSSSRNPSLSGSNLDDSLEPELNKAATLTSPVVEKPAEWKMGDQLWAKVAGHPWWPCMVAKDPYEDLYTKMKGELINMRIFKWKTQGFVKLLYY